MESLLIPRQGFAPWTVQNLSIKLVEDIYTTLPDGSNYPLQVGNLALGGNVNQTFGDPPDNINASLIPGWFFQEKVISGNTYGLHIGSATMGAYLASLLRSLP